MQFTDITVLLDRSASMARIQPAMVSALDEFVLKHQAVPTTRMTLIQFDDVAPQEVVYEARPINQVPPTSLVPRANTPLLDALCVAIDTTGKRLQAMSDADRPDQVLFVIITDGEENASKVYKRDDARRRIEHQHGVYHWEFVYLGANQDVFREAASLGIPLSQAMAYQHDSAGTHAAVGAMVVNTVSYAQNTNSSRGQSRSLSFNADQRQEAAGIPTAVEDNTDDDDA